ncbi:hypothetical protein [Fibrivirga algicola]|uniref:Uncharacterized protein n=1 Tax=Fibrivirga algicola TaxID=2950420 RepID=A0ABX0QK40_9BACT|nr:hypothetical protein [Fibrivirga algicola]NID11601.1 hypothetical protein [Fibrivirga algicola]
MQAQNTIEVQNSLGTLSRVATTLRPFNFGTVSVKGSPFIMPGWTRGEVTLQSGRKLTTGHFNYDALERQVTVKTSARDSVRYQGTDVSQLLLQPSANHEPIIFEHLSNLITDDAALKDELVRIIHRGTYLLVQLPVKKFLKTSASQTYGGDARVGDEYYDASVYYLVRPDHTAEQVKLNRRSLVRALKEKGPALEDFLKTNNIDLADELDIAKALASLDQK